MIDGVNYYDEFLTNSEELELLNWVDGQEWDNRLRRRVQHYGFRYDYNARQIQVTDRIGPLPTELYSLGMRLRELGFERVPDQVIICRSSDVI